MASAIEVLEHTTNPLAFIRQTLAQYQSDTLVFTTETFSDDNPPKPGQWGYYALETGQHIAFFSAQGLTRLAHKVEMQHVALGRIHLFSRRPLSRWRLGLASNKFLVVPLALLALANRGTRSRKDQALVRRIQARTGDA